MRPTILACLVVCACDSSGGGMPGGDDEPPPAGDGIASMYPNDQGIAGDSHVLFADDFESYASADNLSPNWDAIYHRVAITTSEKYAGAKAVEMTAPQQTSELSTAIAKILTGKIDTLYLRYYSKFDGTFDISGSSHNGADISSSYFENGNATPGVPADGTNKFLIAYENWRGEAATTSPGEMNIYVYHPEQRSNYGDHFFPNGDVMPNTSIPGNFGSEFVSRPMFTPELGRWYCYEIMVRANTPGTRDGRVTLWVDGAVIADFPNLRLRDVPDLTIDRFGLNLHFGSNGTRETKKWYDNVVAATSYIGPISK